MATRRLILIVDDEYDFRAICAHLLGRAGYETVTAEDGKTGLAAFKSRRPDLVIVDGNLPDMDGIEVCRRLRGTAGGERVPVLMCTVRSAVVSVQAGLEAGVSDYLLKPFETEEMLERVADALKTTEGR